MTAAPPDNLMLPPPYRWTKRIAKWALVVLAVCAVIRMAWGAYADRRVVRLVAEMRQSREPFSAEELTLAPLPASENAAEMLLNAPGVRRTTTQARILDGYFAFESSSVADVAEVRRWIAANGPALGAVRAARSFAANWGADPGTGRYNPYAAMPRSPAELAELAQYAGIAAVIDGRGGDAVEYFRDVLAITRATRAYPSRIAQTFSARRDAWEARVISQRAAGLSLSPADRPGAGRLIAELLDDAPARDALVHALAVERFELFHSYEAVASGRDTVFHDNTKVYTPPGAVERVVVFVVAPAVRLKSGRAVRELTAQLRAVRESGDYPTARAAARTPTPGRTTLYPVDLIEEAGVWLRPFEDVLEDHFRAVAARRAAAIAVAFRMYRDDHAGLAPDRLDELVHRYLAAVPRDPFDPAGGPIRYATHTGRPILYSVGPDGVDDLASRRWALPPLNQVNVGRPAPDIVFELTPNPDINP